MHIMYNPKDPKSVQKYTSAVTLSDMEIFIFPEIAYALVLANMMSPLLWQWKENDWFQKSKKLPEYKKLLRLRQFIMDNFSFNLDLDTWGLTSKDTELARFKDFVDEKALSQSNALFGYEGDKYYFSMDIRRHFGLDKYEGDVIPYWKTETAEAMHAFKFKEGYSGGAGECVSLATLYAAMLYVNIDIPLEKIFLMATPLHSQNFIDIRDGILTNNRRLVTKSMWFNGTELSAKARRAIENEKITLVANNTGFIHTLYEEATINREDYNSFTTKITEFLTTDITSEVLAGFLRQFNKYQKCFQVTRKHGGRDWYIELEKVLQYEHSSNSHLGDESQSALLKEIEIDEFYPDAISGRTVFNEIQALLKKSDFPLDSKEKLDELRKNLPGCCIDLDNFIKDLLMFCRTAPKLPEKGKKFINSRKIELDGLASREEIVEYLNSIRAENETADLAFTAFRDMKLAPWEPFMKAALERNPVSLKGLKGLSIEDAYKKLTSFESQSIYDGSRMAQPDELWNFGRGDGLEMAIAFLNFIRNSPGFENASLESQGSKVLVRVKNREFTFNSSKNLELSWVI
jgi:hypothetical protein